VAVKVSRELRDPNSFRLLACRPTMREGGLNFANVVEWNTKESNLKRRFRLAASNRNGYLQLGYWNDRAARRSRRSLRSVAPVDRFWMDASGDFGANDLDRLQKRIDSRTIIRSG